MLTQRFITGFLVILALVTAGISPACAFMSGGKSYMEICKADGSIERIEVPSDQNPAAPAPTDIPSDQFNKDCTFCISKVTDKAASSEHVSFAVTQHILFYHVSHDDALIKPLRALAFAARAPPVSLS